MSHATKRSPHSTPTTKWADRRASSLLKSSQTFGTVPAVSYPNGPPLFSSIRFTTLQLRNGSFRNSKGIPKSISPISQKPYCSYRAFIKDCPSGQLDRVEFREIFRDSSSFNDLDEFSDRLFSVFDENRNGAVDFREFICVLSIISRGSLEEKLKRTPRSTDGARPIDLFRL